MNRRLSQTAETRVPSGAVLGHGAEPANRRGARCGGGPRTVTLIPWTRPPGHPARQDHRARLPGAGESQPAATAAHAQRTPRLGIAIIAAAAFGMEMAVSARYGYVRDELYFLAAGHHPAFGYVDQPPLTPLIARLSAVLSGNTLVGLRVVPALGLAALVVLTAAMSRLLGAGRAGQLLAALAVATCAEYLGAMHELTTTMPDFVFWAVTLYLVMRLLHQPGPAVVAGHRRPAPGSPARPSGTSRSWPPRWPSASWPPTPAACCAAATCWPAA